ncbi:CHAT domain-containing protein, partial [bacterium]|nr:CHAT domain-containing protein [bacterium]
ALIYRQRNEFIAAAQQLDEARKRDGLLQDKQGLAAGHRHSGLLALAQNLPQKALTAFHSGLAIAESIGDQRTRCSTQLGLARAFLQLENPDSAAFWVSETITDAEIFLLPEISWRAWQLKGEIAEQADETQIALAAYSKTADIIEHLRGQLQVDDFKAGFLEDKIEIYSRLINLQIRKKMFIAGFHTAERAKSRNFLEMLANREHLISSGKTAPTLLHQDSLLQAINDTQQQLAVLRRKPDPLTVPEKEHLEQWTQQLDQQQKTYETYLQQVQQQTPRMADLMHVQPVSITEIQHDLPQKTGLVEYYLSATHIYTWLVSAGATTAQVIEFPRDSLATIIAEYRDLVSRKLPVDQQAQQLAKLLIQPIDNQLSNFKHLIIIPHGPLHYLPFAALPRQKA